MAFQVCVVMEGLWFKILMEDPYPALSLLAVALSLASGGHLLCSPHPPHSCSYLLAVERHYPSSLISSPILSAQPTASTGAFELTGNLDVRSWEIKLNI